MNILMVASDNSVSSGAFNSMVVLAKRLIDDKNNVLVTIPYEGTGTILLKENNIPYKYIRSYSWVINNKNNSCWKYLKTVIGLFFNIISYFKYKKLIRKNNIQIVHINTTWTYIAAKAAIDSKVKLIWHIREFLEEDQNKKIILKNQGYKLINNSDKIICISNKIYQKYEKIFNKDRMTVIYNGIEIEKYYNKDREIFANNKINLLCVGGISEKKGQFDLCEAVGIIKNRAKYDIELNLIGNYTNEAEEKIKKIKEKYNIDCINLLGIQKNTPQYYSKADIAFMCSVSEAFGRVTVEAMLSGALVIGANSAATAEIIKDEENGLLYEVNDIECLSNRIEYALKNKEKMKDIAKKGQKDAKEKFNAELNEKNILNEYKKLMEEK